MSSSHPWCSRQASSSDQSSTVFIYIVNGTLYIIVVTFFTLFCATYQLKVSEEYGFICSTSQHFHFTISFGKLDGSYRGGMIR